MNQNVAVRSVAGLCSALLFLGAGCGNEPSANPDLAIVDAAPDQSVDLGAAAEDLEFPDLSVRPGPDISLPACKNTGDDCGPPGKCLSCASNSFGHACVDLACGCAGPADCDPGRVCVKGQCAVAGCDANALCNGGCCDNGTCIAGSDAKKCGNDGKACAACADGTPTCANNTCTAGCVVGKAGEPGVCGSGFCCGANDQCQKLADASCGAVGALCADCGKSLPGPKCLMNASCGCAGAADCARGEACKAGVCGAVCDGNSPCNGGCCDNGRCAGGSARAACATGGPLCASCVGNAKGSACLNINNQASCGCSSQTDCPANTACDAASRTCTTACDAASPCNGGCCTAAQNGQCVAGTMPGGCGSNGGVCTNCAQIAQGGRVCVAAPGGGVCGCNSLNDCTPGALACDLQRHGCDFACAANKPCLLGCCAIPMGMQSGLCVLGQVSAACGKGALCADCAASPAGRVCRASQQCGCDKTADCAPGQACDANSDSCTTKCSVNQPCNGGCCFNGACGAGKEGKACGGLGDACVDCSLSKLGTGCVGGSCGCDSAADCPAFAACDSVKKQCTSGCGPNQPCNGGCCLNGMCSDGSANSACGSAGAACAICKEGTPTCAAGKCIAKCGALGDGLCGNGNCCKSGQCVAGNVTATCGFAGNCRDCSNASAGRKCVQNQGGPWLCGCEAKGDCLPANPAMNVGGFTCDLQNKSCTTLCGAPNVSLCNGGCCTGVSGQCRGGAQDVACGNNGGFCAACASGCSPGPKCNPAKGTCGCSALEDCFFAPRCLLGGAVREACSIPRGTCCIPSWFNGNKWPDAGKASNCCSGMSVDGDCTCIATGQPSGGDAAKCCSQREQNGNCICLPTGARCVLESDTNGECCSGQCREVAQRDFRCVASAKGQPCQTDLGCVAPLKCLDTGKCG